MSVYHSPADPNGFSLITNVDQSLTREPRTLAGTFEALDRDRSGVLEDTESPKIVRVAGQLELAQRADGEARLEGKTMQIFDDESIREAFYAEADRNGDLKISPSEFEDWRLRRARDGNARSTADEGSLD